MQGSTGNSAVLSLLSGAARAPRIWISRRLRGHAQFDARFLLEGADDVEEVFGARVAVRCEHSMQALAGFVDRPCQALEAHGRVDQIAQDGLARGRIARQVSVYRFGEQRLAEARVALGTSQNGFLTPCERYHLLVTLLRGRWARPGRAQSAVPPLLPIGALGSCRSKDPDLALERSESTPA